LTYSNVLQSPANYGSVQIAAAHCQLAESYAHLDRWPQVHLHTIDALKALKRENELSRNCPACALGEGERQLQDLFMVFHLLDSNGDGKSP
jgi:hypothetical protein